MSKQTIWLVTMLSIMVVLSAYYIVQGPVEPVDEAASTDSGNEEVTTNEANPLELALFGSEDDGEDQEEETDTTSEDGNEEGETSEEQEGAPTLGGQDYFLTMHTERDMINSQLVAKYTDIMTDPQSTEEQAETASAKLQELNAAIDQVTQMEDLIRGQGYQDALVMHEQGKYDITVQAESLTKNQAVQILELIQGETDIPASNLTVSYYP